MGFVVPVVPAPVEVQRRRIDTMWRRMRRLGASSLAVPLLIADQVVGSTNCYADDRDAFAEHAVRLGLLFRGPGGGVQRAGVVRCA